MKTTYPICTYGDDGLRRKAEPVAEIDDSIRKLADDLLRTMKEVNGVGLAAQQIGRHIQICVVGIPLSYDQSEPDGARLKPHVEMPLVLINPVITERKGVQKSDEACLSVPGISAPIERAFEIRVSFIDLNGDKQDIHVKGFLAKAIQHEVDHLNGMLFVDRVSPVKKITLAGKLRRLKEKSDRQADADA
jgi:peptide deformylase